MPFMVRQLGEENLYEKHLLNNRKIYCNEKKFDNKKGCLNITEAFCSTPVWHYFAVSFLFLFLLFVLYFEDLEHSHQEFKKI